MAIEPISQGSNLNTEAAGVGSAPGGISAVMEADAEMFANRFFESIDPENVELQFKNHVDKTKNVITEENIGAALQECGVNLGPEELSMVFKCHDLNGDGGLNLEEFKTAVKTPTKLQQWGDTLPLSQLLARCLYLRNCDSVDPLRGFVKMGKADIVAAAACFSKCLQMILFESQSALKKCYDAMDRKAVEPVGGNGASQKFETFKMSSGEVADFHKGLLGRVGKLLCAS
jgi:hypothetical protein